MLRLGFLDSLSSTTSLFCSCERTEEADSPSFRLCAVRGRLGPRDSDVGVRRQLVEEGPGVEGLLWQPHTGLHLPYEQGGGGEGIRGGLRLADIDMNRRRLTVNTSLIEASGQPPILGSPKTAASERTITLPTIVIDTVTRHLDTYPPPDSTVWTTEAGGFLRRGTFGRIWRTAVGESVGTPCRIHDLRHTHAAWLIAEGEHPKTIQTRLGHSSIQVTMDRYGHLMDGLDEQTAIRLDAIAATVRNRGANRETPGISL